MPFTTFCEGISNLQYHPSDPAHRMCHGRKVTCTVDTAYDRRVLGVEWEGPNRVHECPTFPITQLSSGGDCIHTCECVWVGCGGRAFLASTWPTRLQRLHPRCWSYDLQCQVRYTAQTADVQIKNSFKQIELYMVLTKRTIPSSYTSFQPILFQRSTVKPLFNELLGD